MRSGFYDFALVHDEDLVGIDDCAQPVSDDDTGSACHEGVEGALDSALGFRIEGAGSFVEDDDLRVFEEDASDCKALFLSAREAGSFGAKRFVQAVGEVADCFLQVSGAKCCPYLIFWINLSHLKIF